MKGAFGLGLLLTVSLLGTCSDPIHLTDAPNIQDTTVEDTTVDGDSTVADGDDTAIDDVVDQGDPAADPEMDSAELVDRDTTDLGDDTAVLGELFVVTARFSWPVGYCESENYTARMSSTANLLSSASNSTYHLEAIRFDVGR